MSRYIDTKWLEDNAKEYSLGYYEEDEWATPLNVLDSAPSIDIVPRKAVKGYEGYYEVDMYGRVYSLERTITVNDNGRVYEKPIKECELSQSTHSAGYKTVGLTRDGKTETAYVHRLVAEAYIPNPQNLPFINHKDEDKANNFVTNLEWCTVQYNNTYGDKTERQANAIRGRKHTQEHIEKIRRSNIGRHGKQKEVVCIDDGKHFPSYADASLYYGISPKTVKSCCERKSQGRKKTFRYADDFCSYGSRSEKPNNCEHITEDGVTCAKYPACDDCLDNPLNKVKGSERLVKGSEQTDLIEDSPSLVKDLVNAFCEDGTWLERQGVYTLTLAEAKQRAVDIIESVLAKDEPTISKMEQVEDEPQTDCNGCKFVGTYDTEFPCANCSRKTKDYYAKDEPQTDKGIGCSRCEGRFDCYDRDMPHAVRCNNYGKVTDGKE